MAVRLMIALFVAVAFLGGVVLIGSWEEKPIRNAAPMRSVAKPAPRAPMPTAKAPVEHPAESAPPTPARRDRYADLSPEMRKILDGPKLPVSTESLNALIAEVDVPGASIYVHGSGRATGGGAGLAMVTALWHDLPKATKNTVFAAINLAWRERTGADGLIELYDEVGVHVAGSTLLRGRFVD